MLLEVAYGKGYYVLSVQVSKDDAIMLVVDGQNYVNIFPTGQPALREIYEFEIQMVKTKPVVVSAFRVNAELVVADEIPSYEALQDLDTTGREAMELSKLREEHEKQLAAIEADPELLAELDKAQKEETEWRQISINRRLQAAGIEQIFSDDDVAAIENESKKPTLTELARASREERTDG